MNIDEFEKKIIQMTEYKNSKKGETLGRMKHNNNLARIANKVYNIIEENTAQFKLKTMSEILNFLESEDLS